MNRHVNAVSGRLSLREPQRESLEILHRITELTPLQKKVDLGQALARIQEEFPQIEHFDREFLSVCFALATGVGKTRLMGAFIAYLHLNHDIQNFFILAPNLTIYNKLIADFTPNTPKYVFAGIGAFAQNPPYLITGENYQNSHSTAPDRLQAIDDNIRVNIFNISKIIGSSKDVRKMRKLSEYIGQSYFDYLSSLEDLVVLMDESHRYRAKAGMKAINELKPILGLELTATPFVEGKGGRPHPFRNVIYDYPLGRAIEDGYVKEPAVVTRKEFSPVGLDAEQIEKMKLEDGIRLHEQTKVELETYAREQGKKIVKPFVLIIARDIIHAEQLLHTIQSKAFFEGRYREKVIQVDSSKTGAAEELMISRLLRVEDSEEPTEIVIHVNMLKEGWDVTNLYTIVPLRAANARILIEQSIGRGLRLPYGKRTGVEAVDRLSIVAHDKFQEIIDAANSEDSPIQLKALVIDEEKMETKTKTVLSTSTLDQLIGSPLEDVSSPTEVPRMDEQVVFTTDEEKDVAQIALQAIQRISRQPDVVPTTSHLSTEEVQSNLLQEVKAGYAIKEKQLELEGITSTPDLALITKTVTELVQEKSIDIPRIMVVPKGEVRSGFHSFQLSLESLNYQPVTEELWQQSLTSGKGRTIGVGQGGHYEKRLEDYVVSGLVDFNDISYDDTSDLLYDLARQTVTHFQGYLKEEDDIRKILQYHKKDIAKFIHAQMLEHYWEDESVEHEVIIKQGFKELKSSAYTAEANRKVENFRNAPAKLSDIKKVIYGGFTNCLFPTQKFDSNPERLLAIILDRDSQKWFKPAKGQFEMDYLYKGEVREYVPDFVAEYDDVIWLLEPKASNQMQDEEVQIKAETAQKWCEYASAHAAEYEGKKWEYKLIPHDRIQENMSLSYL